MLPEGMKTTPWDQACFGIDTYEINLLSSEIFNFIQKHPGHYTLKLDPLLPTNDLSKFGFYYCDTLVEPFCDRQRFVSYENDKTNLDLSQNITEIDYMIENAFLYSRFNRDVNIENQLVDKRYRQWLLQLYKTGNVFKFIYEKQIAGFVACCENKLVLHALDKKYRGKGLAKFFWTHICQYLFASGHSEITSSISMANTSVVNLYISLGFRFRNPLDIYHCLKR